MTDVAGSQSQAPLAGKTLDDLAGDLTRPEKCGFFLPRTTIVTLYQQHDLPPYVGQREEMLRGLFNTAASAQVLPRVIESLQQIVAEKMETYRAWTQRYPAAQGVMQAWGERADKFRRRLSLLRAQTDASPPCRE